MDYIHIIHILQFRCSDEVLAGLTYHRTLEEAASAALQSLNLVLGGQGYEEQTDVDEAAQMCFDLNLAFYDIKTFELRFNIGE
tara:strand:+ start:1093 stop:1341 length:249 start_codon:yes stop_codon:yes gene_type:complete